MNYNLKLLYNYYYYIMTTTLSRLSKFFHEFFHYVIILLFLFLDYKYMIYPVIILTLVYLGWFMNKSCMFTYYEEYNNKEEKSFKYKDLDHSLYLKLDIPLTHIIFSVLFLARYIFKYNIFEVKYSHYLLDLYFITITLCFIINITASYNSYREYKHKRIFITYIAYFFYIITAMIIRYNIDH